VIMMPGGFRQWVAFLAIVASLGAGCGIACERLLRHVSIGWVD